ncbi:MAG: CapA family protein [Lachnospiraceae bacterium]|nr:CapA family protein [Lachnospiraceae bacterium]
MLLWVLTAWFLVSWSLVSCSQAKPPARPASDTPGALSDAPASTADQTPLEAAPADAPASLAQGPGPEAPTLIVDAAPSSAPPDATAAPDIPSLNLDYPDGTGWYEADRATTGSVGDGAFAETRVTRRNTAADSGPGADGSTAGSSSADAGPAPFEITISMVGDCCITTIAGQSYQGSYDWYAANYPPTYFLENVAGVFRDDDFTIANLENVVSDRDLRPVDKGEGTAFWFKAPSAHTQILTSSGVEIVSLANNHTGDYGQPGQQDTIEAVSNAGLLYGDETTTAYFEKNGYRIALICHRLRYEGEAADIIPRIAEAAGQSDFQIVFYHGGTEGSHTVDPYRIRASHAMVDAGADLVVGAHPHVIQPIEAYGGATIVHSLGNFTFGGNRNPKNRTIIYRHTLTIDEQGTLVGQSYEAIPCYVQKNPWQPDIITDEAERQRVLGYLRGEIASPY